MLVLSRCPDETTIIRVPPSTTETVIEMMVLSIGRFHGQRMARCGWDAPANVEINRSERDEWQQAAKRS